MTELQNKSLRLQRSLPKKQISYKPVRYEFRFCSLIAPSSMGISPITNSTNYRIGRARRVLFKKSFLISSWVYYLARKDHYQSISMDKASSIKLAILPARQQMYTLTKAPMAHKTNSKEQFLFKYYNFKFSANLKLEDHLASSSVKQGALVGKRIVEQFPSFSTNILFIKYARLYYPVRDRVFFQILS